jgi:hypothetical protein
MKPETIQEFLNTGNSTDPPDLGMSPLLQSDVIIFKSKVSLFFFNIKNTEVVMSPNNGITTRKMANNFCYTYKVCLFKKFYIVCKCFFIYI